MSRNQRFIDASRKRAQLNRKLLVPDATRDNWPVCLTCGQPVDATELKNVNAFSCELWAKHHGAEDWHRVDFPFRIEGDPLEDDRANWAIQRAMKDACFFDPAQPAK